MSRKSSCSSASSKKVRHCESVDQDIEERHEAEHPPRPEALVVAAHPVDVPEMKDLAKVTPVEQRQPYTKITLPLPAPPPQKVRNAQMEFDFNGEPCKHVVAQQLNMENRDPTGINHDLKTSFLDIFAEPDPQYHSVACVWTVSFRVFEVTRIYCYKILTLIFGLPIAFLAGFIFALFSFSRIWILQPTLKLVRIILAQSLTIWPLFLLYIVRPFFYSVGAMFSTFRLHRTDGAVIKEVWETV
ncbi:hypothetical protein Q1695_003178 [Nippostrongylus brasiliensis]|nr:hypothetical protein Q1695_003178 [Nippostrongylus brasiliensis]